MGTFLAGVAAAAGVSYQVWNGNAAALPADAGAVATPAPSSTPQVVLRFKQPTSHVLPRCNTYEGTGTIPTDTHVLLIFDRAVGPQGEAIDEDYALFGRGVNTPTGWRTPQMDQGADYVEVAAVLVSKSMANFLESMTLFDGNGRRMDGGSWHVRDLPPGDRVPSFVARIDLNGTKSCEA